MNVDYMNDYQLSVHVSLESTKQLAAMLYNFQHAYNFSIADLAEVIGVTRATFYNKRRLRSFTIDELILLIDYMQERGYFYYPRS